MVRIHFPPAASPLQTRFGKGRLADEIAAASPKIVETFRPGREACKRAAEETAVRQRQSLSHLLRAFPRGASDEAPLLGENPGPAGEGAKVGARGLGERQTG